MRHTFLSTYWEYLSAYVKDFPYYNYIVKVTLVKRHVKKKKNLAHPLNIYFTQRFNQIYILVIVSQKSKIDMYRKKESMSNESLYQ